MEAYLSQLLADLLNRHGQFPPEPNMRALTPDPGYPEVMTGAMEFLYGPQYLMEDLFEISLEAFPPENLLTDQQITSLNQAILSLWESVNLITDVPEKAGQRAFYPQLIRLWAREPVSVVRTGNTHLEFCASDPDTCPWAGDVCHCGSVFI